MGMQHVETTKVQPPHPDGEAEGSQRPRQQHRHVPVIDRTARAAWAEDGDIVTASAQLVR